MIQHYPYRIFVLSQRADRPDEPWTIEDVVGPGPIDFEVKAAEYAKGRPYPLNWSFCHEEWKLVQELSGPKTQHVCKGPYYERMLDLTAGYLAQLASTLQEQVKSILLLRNQQ